MFYIKFDERTVQAHATIMSQFCHVLWRIQSMCEEDLITDKVTIKVFVPDWIRDCYMSLNHKYSLVEQLEWFMNNFEEPSCGIEWIMEFYHETGEVTSPWNAQCVWPFKKQWVGGGGYITLQKYKNINEGAFNYNRRMAEQSGQLDIIENIEQYSDYPVKIVDYEMHPSELIDTLIHSEKHYTYMGGSYYTAALINCPTICYGHPIDNVYPDSLEGKGMPGSAWGSAMGNGFSTICQYDFDKTYNGPQTYVTHTSSVNELKGFLLELPLPL
jgi:hypothetical protein